MAASGSVTLVVAVATGVRALVLVGLLLLLAVAVGVVQLRLEVVAQDQGRLRLTRRVAPHPTTVGYPAVVQVEVTRTGRSRLDRLQATERAARELSGGGPLRARVHRAPDRLALSYPIRPSRRGRWVTGPLELRRRDPFGVAAWRGPLGSTTTVAVRPVVAALELSDSATSRDVDRAAAGSRTPAADDAALRDYRTGDDLRRVHWRSSARRGQLVVRQDERAGRRPAAVLLDLPVDDDAGEWTISMGASVALALLRSGHRTRLVSGPPVAGEPEVGGAEDLLDRTVDLVLPTDPAGRPTRLLGAVQALEDEPGEHELVVAVLGPLDGPALAAFARLPRRGPGWAVVRREGTAHQAEETVERLRRAGWTACAVDPGEDLVTCWHRLLDSRDLVVTR